MTRFLKLVRHQNGSWQALPTDIDDAPNISFFDDDDAPIDPAHLLKALDPLLFDNGGIKEASAAQFSSLMKKFSKKLVSRCVYVNVMTVTNPDVLEKLLDQGSWGTLNCWLTDAKETNNLSLLVRLLKLCKLLPMTVERLKENNTPKIVKSLSKIEGEDIQALSHELVTKWMTIIKGETNTTDNSKKKKKAKATKENNKEQKDPKKHGKRDSPVKERKESVSSENVDEIDELSKPVAKLRGLKRTSSDKAISPENFYNDANSNLKEEPALKKAKIERTRKLSNDKTLEELDDAVKKEPKPEFLSKKSRLQRPRGLSNNKTIPPELYEDVKIDIKTEPVPKKPRADRPKTVKSFGAKFRTTGLEEAAPLPKKISKKTPTVNKNIAAAVAKSAVTKRLNSTLPERITEKKIKPESLLNINELSTPSGGIKLIPAKPKPTHILHESASFMDALVAQPSAPLIKRKKKQPPKPVTTPPTSPPIKPPKLQFYKDTLEAEEPPKNEDEKDKKEDADAEAASNEEEEEEEEEGGAEVEQKPAVPNDTEPSATEISVEDSINNEMKKDMEVAMEVQSGEPDVVETSTPGELKSILSHHRKRKPKKSVRWVEDENLKEMFYFELDETERVNVLRNQAFGDLKSMEARQEREALEAVRRQSGDKMTEKITWWAVPILIDVPPPLVEPGFLSQERETQLIRHQSVLQAIYFSRELVPDSAQEPDPEMVTPQEPKIIPLDEENMVGSVVDHSSQKLPTPKLPEVLSSLINIPLSRSLPVLPNHMEQDSHMMSNPMMQQATPVSPASPYDPGEPMSHVMPNMRPMNQQMNHHQQQQQQQQQQQPPPPMPPQPMFNSGPRFMGDPEAQAQMPMQNNWGGVDASLMGPPPERFFTPNVYPMNPYPVMEPNIPPGIPHMGGGGIRRMGGGGRMIRPMGKNPPYHPRPGGPRRGMPHVPCRHFIAGGCRFGANCNFLHPGVNGPAL